MEPQASPPRSIGGSLPKDSDHPPSAAQLLGASAAKLSHNEANLPKTSEQMSENGLPAFVHQYIRDFIILADQKAGFIFAAAAALVAYLSAQSAAKPLQRSVQGWTVHEWVGLIAFILAFLTTIVAVGVVAPRLRANPESDGYIFWKDILRFSSDAEYAEAIEQLTPTAARIGILKHSYLLAGICQSKYRLLVWALRLGILSLISTAGFLVLG